MVGCANYSDNCQPKHCDVVKPITMQDIHNFFDVAKASTCDTKIVYLNRYSSAEILSELYVKQIDQDCHIFYTSKNNYYYVYPNFMQNIVLWSKHKRACGNQGYLGNHISIGSHDNNLIDVHETVYSTYFSNDKQCQLILNKHHCQYIVGPDNKTLTSKNCYLHQLAQVLWDDICCSITSPFVGGLKKQKHRLVVKSKNKEPIMTISHLIKIIDRLMKKNKENENVVVSRLPYIRPSQLKTLAKLLQIDASIVTNTYCKSSALIHGSFSL